MKSSGVAIDHVLEIDVPDAEIVKRLAGRGRDDDKEDTVRKRLDVYRAQTRPLVEYYSKWAKAGGAGAPQYHSIAGVGTVEEISTRALAALS